MARADDIRYIKERFTWEYHPFLQLSRYPGALALRQPGLLYHPTLAQDQLWLFVGCPILPIDEVEQRVRHFTCEIYPDSERGVTAILDRGWAVDVSTLRRERRDG